jgi:hypothetical protein
LPLQREFGRVALPWVRSNGPTDPLHTFVYPAFVSFGRYFTSIHISLWSRQSPLSSTRWHSLLPKNHMLFIVSKQCACSRRVHIEGHMNRFEFLLSWTIIPIAIVIGVKKIIVVYKCIFYNYCVKQYKFFSYATHIYIP